VINNVVLLALFAAVLNTGNDILYRKASTDKPSSNPLYFYILSSAASLVASLGFIIGTDKAGWHYFINRDLFYGSALGVLSFITYILYLSSFTGDNTSVSVTIFRMNMIPSALLAVFFLGETISLRRGIAIFLCLASLLLLGSLRFGKLKDNRHLFLSLGAFLSGGVLNIVNKLAVINGGNTFRLLFIRFTVVVVLTGIMIIVRKSGVFDRKIIIYSILSGLFLMFSIYFTLEALKIGDVTLVLPVVQLSFALIAVISWIFFKEKMHIRKIFGVIIAIAAVLLIN